MMREMIVVEQVRETLLRQRTWKVTAISEHDAIRQILEGDAAEGYKGKKVLLETTQGPEWIVDGAKIEYEQAEAITLEDDFVDIGGGD